MPSSLKFVLKLVLGLAVIAGVWTFFSTQWGWKALPETAPLTFEAYDKRFAQAGEDAAAELEAMRGEFGVPGVTAAVAVDGELVWAAGAGWENLDAETPASPNTLFRIGSTSKAMTATVIARLVDQGVLAPDDTVGAHVPDAPNEDWLAIELDQLLSHTAGFPGYENNSDWPDAYETLRMKRQYDQVEDSLELVDDARLLSEPGEAYYLPHSMLCWRRSWPSAPRVKTTPACWTARSARPSILPRPFAPMRGRHRSMWRNSTSLAATDRSAPAAR